MTGDEGEIYFTKVYFKKVKEQVSVWLSETNLAKVVNQQRKRLEPDCGRSGMLKLDTILSLGLGDSLKTSKKEINF